MEGGLFGRLSVNIGDINIKVHQFEVEMSVVKELVIQILKPERPTV